MTSLRKEMSEDPLSLFVSSAEAEVLSNKAKTSTESVSQRYAQTMSRIGASAAALFAESLSFGDPLSGPSSTVNTARSIYRDSEVVNQARQTAVLVPVREQCTALPAKRSEAGTYCLPRKHYYGSRMKCLLFLFCFLVWGAHTKK